MTADILIETKGGRPVPSGGPGCPKVPLLEPGKASPRSSVQEFDPGVDQQASSFAHRKARGGDVNVVKKRINESALRQDRGRGRTLPP